MLVMECSGQGGAQHRRPGPAVVVVVLDGLYRFRSVSAVR